MKRLLIADDSEILRQRLVELISDLEGLQVIAEAKDIPSAIRSVRESRLELIILDISMPGGSALDVIAEAKNSKPLPIVVMFSEHDSPQYRTLFEQAGASAFFHKGTESAQLLEFLRAAACRAGTSVKHRHEDDQPAPDKKDPS